MGFHAFQSFLTLGLCRAGGESGPCCAQPRRCNSTGVSFSAEIAANPHFEVPISPHLLVAIELQPEKVLSIGIDRTNSFRPCRWSKNVLNYLFTWRLLPSVASPYYSMPRFAPTPSRGGLLSLSYWFRSTRNCCTHPARQAVKSGAPL